MRRFLSGLLLMCVLSAPLSINYAQTSGSAKSIAGAPTTAAKSAELITAAQLKDYLTFIASDEMEGRDTPSRGLDTVAKFIALNLSRWGLKPAGDNNTYFQRIALKRTRLDPTAMSAAIGDRKFKFGEDFLAQPNAGAVQDASAVYVGNGWVIKAKNINPYQNLDVKDKVLVIYGTGLPKGVNFSDLRSGKQGEDWIDPITYAQKNGALGIIVLPDARTLSNWEQTRQRSLERGALQVERFQKQTPAQNVQIPVIVASTKMANALFEGEKVPAATIFERGEAGNYGEPFALSDNKKVSLTTSTKPTTVYTQNVVAILEGGDPVLKNEYIAIGAHYDHVGIGTPVNGDAIYNGADDDGSGTTAVLAMAEAFSHAPTRPKRSILFVWHCGEEKGLWGSQYFTQYPTVPLDKVVAQLNIDMIGRSKKAGDANPANAELSGPDEIYVIGSKMMSTQLGALSEKVNKDYLNLSYNYRYDDPKDPNRFFFRSDHFNYAQKGIPIIFYFDGVHEDYHRPGDEVEKIDFQKMQKVTRTVYLTAWAIAEMRTRPAVDKRLPAELTNR